MPKKQKPPSSLPSIKAATGLSGSRVLVRASLNVPLQAGVVTNQFRIMRALPTINFLRQAGARVIVVAHIGREETDSLRPVFEIIEPLMPARWCDAVTGAAVTKAVDALEPGEVLVLENLRQDPREMANEAALGEELAELADIYVNDAFAASHREHASLVQVPQHLPSYFGFNFVHEYEEITKVMEPADPSLFILGGAKFETKLPLVNQYAKRYTDVFIGGALANDVFKAQGLEVGKSLVSDIDLRDTALMNHLNILLPIDVTVAGDNGVRVTTPDDVAAHEYIYDAGPRTTELLGEKIAAAKTVLWNGPLGNYEKGFNVETESVAKLLAAAPGYSLVGGGDTIAAIEALCIQEKLSFLSTAGGAMLHFLEHGTLPALDAILYT
jgi:phosphoglycerate kinase